MSDCSLAVPRQGPPAAEISYAAPLVPFKICRGSLFDVLSAESTIPGRWEDSASRAQVAQSLSLNLGLSDFGDAAKK